MDSLDNTTLDSATDVLENFRNGSMESNLTQYNGHRPGGHGFYYYDYEAFFSQFRFKLAEFLWTKLSLVFSIVSVLGNLLIILVLTQKTSRNFSTSIFISSLAFSDLFLSVYLFDGFLISNGYILKAYNELDCLIRLFLPRAGSRASSMILAVISIERAVSVKMPHKVKLIFTTKVARVLVATVWCISITSTCLTTYIYGYTEYFGLPSCLIDITNKNEAYTANFIIGKILLIGAWLVNTFCMLFIIKELLKNVAGKSKSNKIRIQSVTITLLVVNIVYFICVTPHVIYDMYTYIYRQLNPLSWYYLDYQRHFNMVNILIFVNYTNNVSNFFIYFLVGTKFRKETKEYFLSCKSAKVGLVGGRSIHKIDRQ